MSTSSPRRPPSNQVAPNISEGLASSGLHRNQSDLKHAMQAEIANHSFSFPPSMLARMLSPKRLKPSIKPAGKMLGLDQYDCDVDVKSFRDALKDVVSKLQPFTAKHGSAESKHYPGLAWFLTGCVESVTRLLTNRSNSRPASSDGTRTSNSSLQRRLRTALRVQLPSGRTLREEIEYRNSRGRVSIGSHHRINLPVEVKDDWKDIVAQAATYARCMFGASPLRTFALVLAFNHSTNTLRFLVFHRGGLTASDECNTAEPGGLEGIARLFLTLALWRTAEEAGAVGCCNDETYLLPADKEGETHVSAAVDTVLFRSLCIRGRATLVFRLQLPASTSSAAVEPEPDSNLPRRSARLIASAGGYFQNERSRNELIFQ